MNYFNLREANTAVTIFTKKALSVPAIKIYEINNTTSALTDITPAGAVAVNIVEDYYKYTFTTPNKSIFIYIQFGDEGIIMRVGTPALKFFHIDSTFTELLTIPYRHIAMDGTIMDSGNLSESTKGLYYLPITTGVDDSFMEVDSTTTSMVASFLSVSSRGIVKPITYSNYIIKC